MEYWNKKRKIDNKGKLAAVRNPEYNLFAFFDNAISKNVAQNLPRINLTKIFIQKLRGQNFISKRNRTLELFAEIIN